MKISNTSRSCSTSAPRRQIIPTGLSGTLPRRYEPRCYLYIVFDLERKLLLTGLLCFVYPGSGTQLGFAIFISLMSKE